MSFIHLRTSSIQYKTEDGKYPTPAWAICKCSNQFAERTTDILGEVTCRGCKPSGDELWDSLPD